VISQSLVFGKDGRRVPAVEIMLNTTYTAELINSGRIDEIRDVMEKNEDTGCKTIDSSLYDIYKGNKITENEALKNASS
jgi:twitching motility protein PilU